MEVFEFILVLVTVIVGLGIAELLGGVVRVLRHELKPGRLHWLWVLVVFNMQILMALVKLEFSGSWRLAVSGIHVADRTLCTAVHVVGRIVSKDIGQS